MEKVFYNKLIRDKIPDKLNSKNVPFETKTLTQEKFEIELRKKAVEESTGLINAQSKEELTSEIADLIFVIETIKKEQGITDDEIKQALRENFEKKGGFDKKLFLLWTAKDDYQTNEK